MFDAEGSVGEVEEVTVVSGVTKSGDWEAVTSLDPSRVVLVEVSRPPHPAPSRSAVAEATSLRRS